SHEGMRNPSLSEFIRNSASALSRLLPQRSDHNCGGAFFCCTQTHTAADAAGSARDDDDLALDNSAHSETTPVVIVPIPSIDVISCSPAWIGPTPGGAPVKIRSP